MARFFRGADPVKVYAETSSFVTFLNAPTSPAPDATALLEVEQITPAIPRLIDSIANDASSVPLRLFDVRGPQPREILDHPAIELFRFVNPVDTQTILFRNLFADLCTEGNFFGFLEFEGGIPVKIVRLPPEQVDVIVDPVKLIAGYRWKPPGAVKPPEYTVDQIMHVRTRNSASTYRGMGKLVRLRNQILLERAMRQWKLKQFENGVPTGVVVTVARQVGTDSEWERFQEETWQRMKGPENASKPWFIRSGEATITTVPRPTEDELGFIDMLKFLRAEYAMLFGVPPSRLSDYSESFRSAAAEQGRTYWQDEIMAWHRLLLDYLNSTFLPRFFPDARIVSGRPSIAFAYDYSKVRALALSQRDQAQLNEILVRNGLRTPNEATISMGDPAHDDANADELYMNGRPLGETAPQADGPLPSAGPGGDMGPNGQTGDEESRGAEGARSVPNNGRESAYVR